MGYGELGHSGLVPDRTRERPPAPPSLINSIRRRRGVSGSNGVLATGASVLVQSCAAVDSSSIQAPLTAVHGAGGATSDSPGQRHPRRCHRARHVRRRWGARQPCGVIVWNALHGGADVRDATIAPTSRPPTVRPTLPRPTLKPPALGEP